MQQTDNGVNGFKLIVVFIFLALIFFRAIPQVNSGTGDMGEKKPDRFILSPISKYDSVALSQLPEIAMPEYLLKKTLPSDHDNSDQPYFREWFGQIVSECGQYTGIAFSFTYEINYRRNLPAAIPENLYPTFYSYNFDNGGYGYQGVNYFQSFEIVRTNGQPNEADYGGTTTGGPSRWLTGYENYFHGMFNKLENAYQIKVGTPEGLLNLKHWLYDHMEGSEVGGLASFYSSSPWNTTLLPDGTPEGGKLVITGFSGPAGHAMTITGWNDSIRFDVNNDGQYTNNLDINSDGQVDMKDWEIGGLRFMNSYTFGNVYDDSTHCYMLYRTLAENVVNGGIWNNVVHIVKVKENYKPLLAMKITINHNSRDKVKVLTGVSSNVEDEQPAYTLGFPIFNFQGASQYMQGGNFVEENKTIEFGLDITPLLGEINPNQPSKFFLQVIEKDPQNAGSGSIVNFSLMDYTNGMTQIDYPQSNIPIENNATTTISIPASINFNQLEITTNELPLALINEPYEFHFTASGGLPPYQWNILRHFEQNAYSGEFPEITAEKLNLSDTIRGIAMKKIGFLFPFYGNYYDTIYIHNEGFLTFEPNSIPWPYLYDEALMIKKSRIIAPFLDQNIVLDTLSGDGVWFEGDNNQAAFRWRCTSLTPFQADLNFALILYPAGEIEFYYTDDLIIANEYWAAGISEGDGKNYSLAESGISTKPYPAIIIKFIPVVYPNEMSLTLDGIFSGIPQKHYNGIEVEFALTDYNNITVRKTFLFYSSYAGNEEWDSDIIPEIKIFPNPFLDFVNIELNLKNPECVSIIIHDINGREVASVVKQQMITGKRNFIWRPLNSDGYNLQSGIFYCQVKFGDQTFARKLILLKNR